MGETIPFDFVHIITESMLPTLRIVSENQIIVMFLPKRSTPQKPAYWYRLLAALRSRKKKVHHQICERTEQGAEQM
jgi:hypothetical protein